MTDENIKLASNWLCQAMFEWDSEMVPCRWSVETDTHNKTMAVEWQMVEFDNEGNVKGLAPDTELHRDEFTFDEVLQGIEAAKPIIEKHKAEVAMYWVFEVAVQIIRSAKSN